MEKLEQPRPAKEERTVSIPQRKQARSPDCDGERVKVSESWPLAKDRGIRAGAWRIKGGLHGEERRMSGRREGKT